MEHSEKQQEESLAWSPIVSAVVVAVPGLIGLASGQLFLFPSLGPTAVMQAHSPRHKSSRLYNVLVSHFAGAAAAYFAVAAFGIAQGPSVFEMQTLTAARVGATVVALFLAVVAELALNASHPPAASTTLLVALGSFKAAWHDVAWLVVGIVVTGLVGEAVRRMRLRFGLGVEKGSGSRAK